MTYPECGAREEEASLPPAEPRAASMDTANRVGVGELDRVGPPAVAAARAAAGTEDGNEPGAGIRRRMASAERTTAGTHRALGDVRWRAERTGCGEFSRFRELPTIGGDRRAWSPRPCDGRQEPRCHLDEMMARRVTSEVLAGSQAYLPVRQASAPSREPRARGPLMDRTDRGLRSEHVATSSAHAPSQMATAREKIGVASQRRNRVAPSENREHPAASRRRVEQRRVTAASGRAAMDERAIGA